MENQTKSKSWIVVLIVALIIILAGFVGWILFNKSNKPKTITTSGETNTGQTVFTSTKGEIIKITSLVGFNTVTSPLEISGQVKGTWSFEASFPVILNDASGKILAQTPARLTGDWMTTNYVPFTVTLNFDKSATSTGTLILQKDNPSGDPSQDDSVQIPVTFK